MNPVKCLVVSQLISFLIIYVTYNNYRNIFIFFSSLYFKYSPLIAMYIEINIQFLVLFYF
jgi:hypothetical protein